MQEDVFSKNESISNYTSNWCKPSKRRCSLSELLEERAPDFPLSRCWRKSMTTGSVQGAPNGASGPATHPRWPPLGVTINIQFGLSWNNSKGYTILKFRWDRRTQEICSRNILQTRGNHKVSSMVDSFDAPSSSYKFQAHGVL